MSMITLGQAVDPFPFGSWTLRDVTERDTGDGLCIEGELYSGEVTYVPWALQVTLRYQGGDAARQLRAWLDALPLPDLAGLTPPMMVVLGRMWERAAERQTSRESGMPLSLH
ncbi:hypothetical protein [Deinococcus sonorensis]|uniref:Uncharacterized protein n=1 Tax=Deinococcus sonorensis TaxID=309891 RepID=A0ABV8Y8G5_9DEIO